MVTAETILQDVESLNHTSRVHYMVTLGRRVPDEPDVRAAIADLSQGDFMGRYLALCTCFTSRDGALVLRSLADPSRIIRNLALRLITLAGTPEDFASAFEVVAPQSRIALLKRLHKHHQTAIIDAFLATSTAQDDLRFLQMLPFGSPVMVRRQQARFQDEANAAAWLRLARLHPDIALEWLEARVQTGGGVDARIGDLLFTLAPMLPASQAKRILALFDLYGQTHTIKYWQMQPCIARFPGEMADFVLAHDEGNYYGLSFVGQIKRLTIEQIIAINNRSTNMLGYDLSWLGALPMETRLRIYETLREDGTLRWDCQELAALPADVREQEARRCFADTKQALLYRLEYAIFFPWDEMLAIIGETLHSSTSGDRRVALDILISATQYHPERMGEMLLLLQERRSEQDPVRATMCNALAKLPPTRWQAEHLPLLSEVIRHGLNDVGLSDATLQGFLRLLIKIAPFQTDWATEQIATVIRERGFVAPKTVMDSLSQPARTAIFAALIPVLQRRLVQAKVQEVIQVVSAFAAGDDVPDAVVALLTHALNTTSDSQITEDILRLLRRYRRAQFTELVPELLVADPSWITLPMVAHFLLRQRQDLLTPFLGYRSYDGRFATGQRRFLLPIEAPATGLTTRQQEIYASTLDAIIADPEQESAFQTRAIHRLALLPGISTARLRALANHPNTLMRTTALLAIGRVDSADGLPTIVEALQDSRGRIAILILQRYIRTMPAEEALAILRDVPMSRVSVAKSVVRLLATIPAESAFQELLALAGRDLHRDVHSVVLEALWQHPTRPEIWPVMQANLTTEATKDRAQAALPPRSLLADASTLRRAIGEPPLSILTHALRLLRSGLDHPDEDVRPDALWRCVQVAVPDADGIVVPRLLALAHEAHRGEVDTPTKALLNLCTATDATAVAELFAAKQSMRHDIDQMVDLLIEKFSFQDDRLLSTSRAVMAMLATDPVLATLRGELAFGTLSADAFLAFLRDAVRSDLMHAGTLHAICMHIEGRAQRFKPAEWEMLQQQLAASDAAYLRRIGFSCLLARTNRRSRNWAPEDIAALQTFRADTSPLVAAAAQFHYVPSVDDADEDD